MLLERKNKFNFIKRMWAYLEDDNDDGGAGDDEQTSLQAGSTSTDVDMETQSVSSSPTVEWDKVLPEDVRKKPHFQNILKSKDPFKELYTQYDNAQTLIGKRAPAVPKDDASDDDVEKYYATTRPEKADEYEFAAPEFGKEDAHIKDFMEKQGIDEGFQKELKDDAHKYGLTKRQASGFVAAVEGRFLKKLSGVIKEQHEAEANLDKHFDTMVKENFSGDKEQAIEAGRNFINKLATAKTKKYAQGLPNEALMIIADMGQQFKKKYEGEDTIDPKGGTGGAESYEAVRDQMHGIMNSEAYLNPMHAGNEKALSDVKGLSDRMRRLRMADQR